MDKKDKLKKIKPFTPVLFAALVAACAGISLHGYEAPAYAYEAPAVEEETQKEEKEEKEEEEKAPAGAFDLEDGVYRGTGTGYAGEITVEVQIKDCRIVSIEVLSSYDDQAFLNRAKTVIDRMIQAQDLNVDTVSGATFSSKGIISAVRNALTGEKDQSETGASQTGGAAAKGEAAVELTEEAKAYKDGTYYGTGTGFGGTLKVKVEIGQGKITLIQIVEHQDGSSYIQKASGVISQIITAQSTNVDTVSGATYSSAGIIRAVRDALSQAAVSPSPDSPPSDSDTQQGTDYGTYEVSGTVPYDEGIYYGTAEGYAGDITVAVVIQDHTIKAILVTEHEDDDTFFDRAMEVVKNVVRKQNTDVDTVSGATYSSSGLLGAVKNALKEAERATNGEEPAAGQVDYSVLEKAISQAETLTADEYTQDGWEQVEDCLTRAREALTAQEQETVDRAAEELYKALGALEKKDGTGDEEEEDTVYLSGVYQGMALCLPDADEDFEAYCLSLKVTVRNDRIVSVTEVAGDGPASNDSYIKRAANGTSSMPGVVTQIVEKGTTGEIDTVSRATCSSKSIIEACQNALKSAKRP